MKDVFTLDGVLMGIPIAIWTYLFGNFDMLIQFMLIMFVVDFVSGMIASKVTPETKITSKKWFTGLWKKGLMMLVVLVATWLAKFYPDVTIFDHSIRHVTIVYVIGLEIVSFFENVKRGGGHVPQFLRDIAQTMVRDKNDKVG